MWVVISKGYILRRISSIHTLQESTNNGWECEASKNNRTAKIRIPQTLAAAVYTRKPCVIFTIREERCKVRKPFPVSRLPKTHMLLISKELLNSLLECPFFNWKKPKTSTILMCACLGTLFSTSRLILQVYIDTVGHPSYRHHHNQLQEQGISSSSGSVLLRVKEERQNR